MVIPVHRCSSHVLGPRGGSGRSGSRGEPRPGCRRLGSVSRALQRAWAHGQIRVCRSPGTRAKCPRRGVEWLDRLSSGSAQRGSGWAGTNPQGFYSPAEPLPCPPVQTSPLREPLAGLSVTHMLTSVIWQCTDSLQSGQAS